MRTTRLARLAAQAEILLIRREIKTVIRRVIYGAVAAVFGIAVIVLLHVLGYMALVQFAGLMPVASAAIVLGVDLVFAGVFAVLANGAMKDPVAEEARLLRDQSLAQIKDTLTLASVFRPAGRIVGRKGIYSMLAAGLAARIMGGRR